MGYFEYDTGYYEPSEFEIKCEELMDMLRANVTDELKSELDTLRKENASMRDIVNNYDAKVKELESMKRKFQFEESTMRRQIEQEVRRERLSKILEDFQTTIYCVYNQGKERPKCDKCDDDRIVHFKSPNGRDMTETCSCKNHNPYYIVQEAECKEFKISDFETRRGQLVGWYSRHDIYGEDDDYYTSATFCSNKMYNGQDFSTIKYPYDVYFYDKETAQKYADWLNEKSGTA